MASKKQTKKVGKVMHEYKVGALHSGSKKGPVVKSRKQAIAIAMSEAKIVQKKKKKKPNAQTLRHRKYNYNKQTYTA
jgi:hypothetical protein